MIRHQNIFANEHAARQTRLAKRSKILVDPGVGEQGFAILGIRGDEVKRMTGEKPVKTFESLWGRSMTAFPLVRVHARNDSGFNARRKKFEQRHPCCSGGL